MSLKFLSESTLRYLIQEIEARLNGKVDRDKDKQLSEEDFTSSYKVKLDSIEYGAQANLIEEIKVEGTKVKPVNGVVDIEMPLKLPEGLKSGYVTTGKATGSTSADQVTIEGVANTVSAMYGHGEGMNNETASMASHVEGKSNTIAANSPYAHAEGQSNAISPYCDASHAEGQECTVQSYARYSHAQNLGTIVNSEAGTAIGKYNVEDTNKKLAFIIGNGQSSAQRNNAFSVDWNGNVTCGTINNVSTSKIITKDNLAQNNILTSSTLDVNNILTRDNIEEVIAALPSVDGELY